MTAWLRDAAARAVRSAFLRDSGVLTAAGVASAVIAVVQGVLVARWLGPAAYGVVALVSAYPSVVLSLLRPDSPHATVRYLADRDTAGDPHGALAACKLAHTVDVGVALLAFFAVAVTAPWAEHHVVRAGGAAGLVVLTAAALVVASPAEASTAVLVHARRFRLLAVEQVASAAVRSALIVALVASGRGATGAVQAVAIATVFHGVTLAVLGGREAKRSWGAWWPAVRTRHLGRLRFEMLRFMVWTDLGGVLGTVTKQLDVVLLGWLSGAAEAGIYRLARSIAALPGYVVGPLQAAVYPRLAGDWAASGWESMRETLRRHVQFGAGLAAAGLVGVAALPPVVRGLAGDAYGPAVGVSQVLLAASLVWLGLYWLRPTFMAVGDVRAWVAISAAVVAGSLVAFLAAAMLWGAMGLAVVQAGAALAGHGVALRRLRSRCASRAANVAPGRIEVVRS